MRVTVSAAAAAALVVAGLTACGSNASDPPKGKASTDNGFAVGLLLPESTSARYESADRPLITQHITQLCPKCTVEYANAGGDAAKQKAQADAMLDKVKVLVLDPVDVAASAGIVENAKTHGVPVVSYARMADGPVAYHVGYGNQVIGEQQANALLGALGGNPKHGQVVMINGAPNDPSAAETKQGAHSVLDGKVNIGREFDTPGPAGSVADNAQLEMEQAIVSLGRANIAGVYAADDAVAGGAIAAMKDAGFTKLPPVTGANADADALQRILAGDQLMTVYSSIKSQADTAAALAIAAATGKNPSGTPEPTKVDNGTRKVKAVLLPPASVTRNTLKDTVFKDGTYKASQICTDQYAAACKSAGIS
jgi:D-xylose transport system substrate-binding protein